MTTLPSERSKGSSPCELILHTPPYRSRGRSLHFGQLANAAFPDASLLLITGQGADQHLTTGQLLPTLRQIRSETPWISVALVIGPGHSRVELARQLAWYDAGLLVQGAPPSNLRPQLTDTAALGIRARRLFKNVRPEAPPTVCEFIEAVFQPRLLASLTEFRGSTLRLLRGLLAHHSLPSPRYWKQLARVLPSALMLERETAGSIEALALRDGWYGGAALSDACTRAFGLRPTKIRGLLGWRWLVRRWMERHL